MTLTALTVFLYQKNYPLTPGQYALSSPWMTSVMVFTMIWMSNQKLQC